MDTDTVLHSGGLLSSVRPKSSPEALACILSRTITLSNVSPDTVFHSLGPGLPLRPYSNEGKTSRRHPDP